MITVPAPTQTTEYRKIWKNFTTQPNWPQIESRIRKFHACLGTTILGFSPNITTYKTILSNLWLLEQTKVSRYLSVGVECMPALAFAMRVFRLWSPLFQLQMFDFLSYFYDSCLSLKSVYTTNVLFPGWDDFPYCLRRKMLPNSSSYIGSHWMINLILHKPWWCQTCCDFQSTIPLTSTVSLR